MRKTVFILGFIVLALVGCASTPKMVVKEPVPIGPKVPCSDKQVFVGVFPDSTAPSIVVANEIRTLLEAKGFEIKETLAEASLSVLVKKPEEFFKLDPKKKPITFDSGDVVSGYGLLSLSGQSNPVGAILVTPFMVHEAVNMIRDVASKGDRNAYRKRFSFVMEIEYGTYDGNDFISQSKLAVKGGTEEEEIPIDVYVKLGQQLAEQAADRISL